jgi:hypothetical protein
MYAVKYTYARAAVISLLLLSLCARESLLRDLMVFARRFRYAIESQPIPIRVLTSLSLLVFYFLVVPSTRGDARKQEPLQPLHHLQSLREPILLPVKI